MGKMVREIIKHNEVFKENIIMEDPRAGSHVYGMPVSRVIYTACERQGEPVPDFLKGKNPEMLSLDYLVYFISEKTGADPNEVEEAYTLKEIKRILNE